jgi:hypothetical protein
MRFKLSKDILTNRMLLPSLGSTSQRFKFKKTKSIKMNIWMSPIPKAPGGLELTGRLARAGVLATRTQPGVLADSREKIP